jgi:selenide,water dikinase
VYALDEHRALVQTVDFFTPVVDDPTAYGQIAAANALSDVYAMGGRPLTALAIACFPKDADAAILAEIFRGGLGVLQAAGVALLGGHTVQDAEIKFGYAVTGEVDRARIWTNGGARDGDALLLTKPLGTGVIATALKFGRAPAAAIDRAIQSMTATNRAAADALGALPPDTVHACTDVTGFGLIGHATEMARASGRTLEVRVDDVPALDGALELIDGNTPGGARTNREHFASSVREESAVDRRRVDLLYDPQTSGGLLISVSSDNVDAARNALTSAGSKAWVIGRVVPNGGHAIRLL